ncbi:hypothetical protein TNCV_612921 [Trichonephila clavipes]|nr:hypothetical protein TNCV_612921 [Trichonephila clavipes]
MEKTTLGITALERTGDNNLVRASGLFPPRRHSLFEAISRHSPRHQSPKSDRSRQTSHYGTLSCPLCLQPYWCRGPEAEQWTMIPKPRALSPTHKQATCFPYVKQDICRGMWVILLRRCYNGLYKLNAM